MRPIKYIYGHVGLGFFRPNNPTIFNYNPTGSKLVHPGPDGFGRSQLPTETEFWSKKSLKVAPIAHGRLASNKWEFNGGVFPNFETFQQAVPREFIIITKPVP